MNKRILIADDDPAILEVVSLILEDAGYQVDTCNGDIRFSEQDVLPDLFLLDIWMSEKDGRETCRQLKNNERTKNLPVIIVSANRDIEKITEESGADAFLAKPFEMNDLLTLIAKYI